MGTSREDRLTNRAVKPCWIGTKELVREVVRERCACHRGSYEINVREGSVGNSRRRIPNCAVVSVWIRRFLIRRWVISLLVVPYGTWTLVPLARANALHPRTVCSVSVSGGAARPVGYIRRADIPYHRMSVIPNDDPKGVVNLILLRSEKRRQKIRGGIFVGLFEILGMSIISGRGV